MSDQRLNEAIAQLVPLRSARGDWVDVLARAHGRSMFEPEADRGQQARRHRTVFRDKRVIAAAAAVALLGAAGASAFAIYGSGPSPGLTAGVSSLDRLPRPASLPDSVTRQLPDSVTSHRVGLASSVGISTAEAEASMRLLRADLPQGDLYAFRGTEGRVCFILTRGVSLCPNNASAGEPGVNWVVSGGSPGEEGWVVAVVADNVSHVELIADDARTTIPVINNSIYAALPKLSQNGHLSLSVSYRDGSQTELHLPNPYAAG